METLITFDEKQKVFHLATVKFPIFSVWKLGLPLVTFTLVKLSKPTMVNYGIRG